MNDLFSAIAHAVQDPDFERAVALVRSALGQERSNITRTFFKGCNEESWPFNTVAERRRVLAAYVHNEIMLQRDRIAVPVATSDRAIL
ncbi:hypothetical protein SAMN05518849_1398 [Sphingobium sp. AP50]|uniref:hypothetical protein n=1 Tax=Sphingobium sp. AP50 TaxID=1884369 RepID=UPI0008C57103|nr:hypothetical protein [Sphingobium sp. AP50]SEK05837.1 hypothetical protein SAMN05518849_1398 [Sphingobium sp. AP50]